MWLIVAVLGAARPAARRARRSSSSDAGVLGLAIGPPRDLPHGAGRRLRADRSGKMLMGVAVVRRDGAVPGYGRALLRCVGGGLCAADARARPAARAVHAASGAASPTCGGHPSRSRRSTLHPSPLRGEGTGSAAEGVGPARPGWPPASPGLQRMSAASRSSSVGCVAEQPVEPFLGSRGVALASARSAWTSDARGAAMSHRAQDLDRLLVGLHLLVRDRRRAPPAG